MRKLQDGARNARRIKVREVHILSTVVAAGSMAKAATQLCMSQPSVSEAIANLEALLHIRLLDRSPRGIEPTIYARALLQRGRAALDELDQAVKDIEFLADPTKGELRIGCAETFSAGFVPAIIQRVLRQHPQLSFQIIEANTASRNFRELRDRNIDLMLGNVAEPLREEDICTEVLFEDSLFAVVGNQNALARRRRLTLADLIDMPWILAGVPNVVHALVREAFDANGLPLPKMSITSASMHVRLHLLTTGNYVTVFTGSLLRFNAARWNLKILPVNLGIQLSVAIVRLKHRTLSPIAQIFIEHARAVASSTKD
jgi:DNA-binding transcriptional LysR family regulator